MLAGPCPEGMTLKRTKNAAGKPRVECVSGAAEPEVSDDAGPNLCDRGFVFDASKESCVKVGASFGDSSNLDKFLDEYFFGK
jgi:hypothetical protein